MKKRIVTILSAALIACAFFVTTASADININIPTTPKQDAKLVKVLDYLNRDRDPPFADIEEALTKFLIRDVKQLIREMDERELQAIFEAWQTADETVKDQIRLLLGIP